MIDIVAPHPRHTHRGKWSEPNVPHRGWTCVGVEDLGEPSRQCEMCESVDVRYVHHMEHPDYLGSLAVGCICAEHMEQDYVKPRERESRLKSAARRRNSWDRRTWSKSVKGNSYINTDGFNITVFARDAGWGLSIINRVSNRTQRGQKIYLTQDAAKAAAFDALIWARENL